MSAREGRRWWTGEGVGLKCRGRRQTGSRQAEERGSRRRHAARYGRTSRRRRSCTLRACSAGRGTRRIRRQGAKHARLTWNEREPAEVADDLAHHAADDGTTLLDAINARDDALCSGSPEATRSALEVGHHGPVGEVAARRVLRDGRRVHRACSLRSVRGASGFAVDLRLDVPARILVEQLAPEQRITCELAPGTRDAPNRED